MPRGPFVEDSSPPGELRSRPRRLRRGHRGTWRRSSQETKVARRTARRGTGIFGVVAVFPVLRSLGPLPKGTLFHTDWRKGTFAVDQTGRRVNVGDLTVGSIMTVFPEGSRTPTGPGRGPNGADPYLGRDFVTQKGRETWGPKGTWRTPSCARTSGVRSASTSRSSSSWSVPATSRCSTSPTAAIPEFGPAPRPLPQLPLYIDADGLHPFPE